MPGGIEARLSWISVVAPQSGQSADLVMRAVSSTTNSVKGTRPPHAPQATEESLVPGGGVGAALKRRRADGAVRGDLGRDRRRLGE